MTEELVLSIGAEAIKTTLLLATPMLIAAMATGLVISVLQAVTQINEATLTFIPKIFAVVVVLVVTAPWMLKILEQYAVFILGGAGEWVK